MAVPDGFSTWHSKRPPILGGLFSNFIRDSIHQPVLNTLKAADLYGSANLLVDCLADLHGERHRFFYFGFKRNDGLVSQLSLQELTVQASDVI